MAANSVKITIAKVLRNSGLGTRANQEVLNYIKEIVKEHNNSNLITIENNYSSK